MYFYELDLYTEGLAIDGTLGTRNLYKSYSKMEPTTGIRNKDITDTFHAYSGNASFIIDDLEYSGFYFNVEVIDIDGEGIGSKEVTTQADEDSGETGILIPAAIATVVIGGGVGVLRNRKKEKIEINLNRKKLRKKTRRKIQTATRCVSERTSETLFQWAAPLPYMPA